jgi:hypothetical protein
MIFIVDSKNVVAMTGIILSNAKVLDDSSIRQYYYKHNDIIRRNEHIDKSGGGTSEEKIVVRVGNPHQKGQTVRQTLDVLGYLSVFIDRAKKRPVKIVILEAGVKIL